MTRLLSIPLFMSLLAACGGGIEPTATSSTKTTCRTEKTVYHIVSRTVSGNCPDLGDRDATLPETLPAACAPSEPVWNDACGFDQVLSCFDDSSAPKALQGEESVTQTDTGATGTLKLTLTWTNADGTETTCSGVFEITATPVK